MALLMVINQKIQTIRCHRDGLSSFCLECALPGPVQYNIILPSNTVTTFIHNFSSYNHTARLGVDSSQSIGFIIRKGSRPHWQKD